MNDICSKSQVSLRYGDLYIASDNGISLSSTANAYYIRKLNNSVIIQVCKNGLYLSNDYDTAIEVPVPSDWEMYSPETVGMFSRSISFRVVDGPQKGRYLSCKGSSIVYSESPFPWIVEFLGVPVISLSDLVKVPENINNSHRLDLFRVEKMRDLTMQITRAHQDCGFFFVTGHNCGIHSLMYMLYDLAVAEYVDDREDDHVDDNAKFNSLLASSDGGMKLECDEKVAETSRRVFVELEKLSEAILTILANGQSLVTNSNPDWYYHFQKDKFLCLRSLTYHPGPDGVQTCERHTDATLLTLLVAQGRGLQIVRDGEWMDVDSPPDGGILVNTGNVLQEISDGFFKAVCHRVVRKDGHKTRISMPFFYDRYGSTTGGC